MAFIIDEERFINDNILKYDERVKSPIARFIDKTPTFVVYYHINNYESTSDEGFQDIESVIGDKSPLRFQKIDKFPIYGIDQIIVQLQDTEVGIDVGYEGEAVILPNTIKPLPNDFFVIPYLNDEYLFRVTNIEYDNIRADNFYKINFKLDANDEEKKENIEKQIHDKYTCVLNNIGTMNKCIIQQDCKDQLDKIDYMYDDMVNLYLSIFYNSRYNVLLGEDGSGNYLYDPFMTVFINSNKLFSKKNSLETIVLEADHIFDNKKKLKYERSIYRFMERRNPELVKPFLYTTFAGVNRSESGFAKWVDNSIQVIDLPADINPDSSYRILSDIAVETIRLNGPTDSQYLKLMIKFIRNENISIYDIPLNMNEELIKLDGGLEMFFITPILLYIIKEIVREFHETGIASPAE